MFCVFLFFFISFWRIGTWLIEPSNEVKIFFLRLGKSKFYYLNFIKLVKQIKKQFIVRFLSKKQIISNFFYFSKTQTISQIKKKNCKIMTS